MTTNFSFQTTDQNTDPTQYLTEMEPGKNIDVNKSPWLRGFGLLIPVLLAVFAFAPDLMNVPMGWRPWLFITFTFWFVSYCSRIFTP